MTREALPLVHAGSAQAAKMTSTANKTRARCRAAIRQNRAPATGSSRFCRVMGCTSDPPWDLPVTYRRVITAPIRLVTKLELTTRIMRAGIDASAHVTSSITMETRVNCRSAMTILRDASGCSRPSPLREVSFPRAMVYAENQREAVWRVDQAACKSRVRARKDWTAEGHDRSASAAVRRRKRHWTQGVVGFA